jgi:hypothetical protein
MAKVKKTAAVQTAPPHLMVLSPTIQSAASAAAWATGPFGEADINELVSGLREQVKAVADGNLQPLEAMLYGQAVALQTIFTNLSRRAANQEYLKQFQAHLMLALKAQAQCRCTLQALAEIKNPRPFQFVGQANIAQGPQQVNNGNGTRPPAPAREEKDATLQNGLLEDQHGQWLDTRAQSPSGRVNPALATLGAVERAAHG